MQYFSIITTAPVYSRQINNQQKNIHKQGGKEKGQRRQRETERVKGYTNFTQILLKSFTKVKLKVTQRFK